MPGAPGKCRELLYLRQPSSTDKLHLPLRHAANAAVHLPHRAYRVALHTVCAYRSVLQLTELQPYGLADKTDVCPDNIDKRCLVNAPSFPAADILLPLSRRHISYLGDIAFHANNTAPRQRQELPVDHDIDVSSLYLHEFIVYTLTTCCPHPSSSGSRQVPATSRHHEGNTLRLSSSYLSVWVPLRHGSRHRLPS